MSHTVALAVDFGGTKVDSALITADGRVVEGSRHRAPTGRAASSEELEASVRSVVEGGLALLNDDMQLVGVGVGSAGPITRTSGAISPLNVPAWREYPVRDFVHGILSEHGISTRVHVEMDGVAIVLAEHWIGAAQGVNNVMGMVVSTGIGGGLILDGRVITGPTGNAGHIGHIEVGGMTGDDTFGGVWSLEAIASGPHTVTWARSQGFSGSTGEDIASAYRQGDPVARAAVERTGTALGQAIASATALLDLELVAIGGGFSHATPDLFDAIRAVTSTHYFPFVRKVKVVPSGLSDEGPLIGAGALIHRSELLPALQPPS